MANFPDKFDRVALRDSFEKVWGDTRRPINEVTLWDYSFIIAALYKAALAFCLLVNQKPEPVSIRWRLLSVRVDGIQYLLGAQRIPDLLARKTILANALDRVKFLLEDFYRLALEVYRDENGSIYVFPDLDVLDCTDKETSLGEIILEEFGKGTIKENISLALKGEVVPCLREDSTEKSWRAKLQLKEQSKDVLVLEVPPVNEHIAQHIPFQSCPATIGHWWEKNREEVCIVCGLRPRGYGAQDREMHYKSKQKKEKCPADCQTCKAITRGVCDICEHRRADRAREWATERLFTTIWMDEVADVNGRVALLAGQFDLTHWLDGTLVRTLAVRNPANVNETEKKADAVAKNPSFARLRRIWETTRKFWQEILPAGEGQDPRDSIAGRATGLAGPRLAIRGALKPARGAVQPGPYHAYSLVLEGGVRLDVVWDGQKGRFLTAANLACVARLLGESQPDRRDHEDELAYQRRLHQWGARKIEQAIKKAGGETLVIEEPAGSGTDKFWGEISGIHVEEVQGGTYVPVIPILAEPRTFLALVPAGRALAVVRAIKEKYEREMGKVRNRLPLNMGLVFADRRTPLRAVLDAGRRMLKGLQEAGRAVEGWRVDFVADFNGERSPDFLGPAGRPDPHFARWRELKLVKKERTATWRVPLVMGDARTKDHWYPYVFMEQPAKTPADKRGRSFSGPNPWKNNGPGKLVHAEELEEGDLVFFAPAALDWVWLDSAGRRFEVAYDQEGVRLDPALQRRPYLLDELGLLEDTWENLSGHLTATQIYTLRDLIERKRAEWQKDKCDLQDEEVFRQFCLDAVASARWRKGRDGPRKNKYPWEVAGKDRPGWLAGLAVLAARGLLADCIELHLQILKRETRSPFEKGQEVEE
ncbi:MAG: hypothetical protein AB1523_03690 [Bacillota bacterium]